MHEIPTDGVSARDVFAQLLRQLLDRGGLAQATLARRLRQRGIAQVTEPRVSDGFTAETSRRNRSCSRLSRSWPTPGWRSPRATLSRGTGRRREPRQSPGIEAGRPQTGVRGGESGAGEPSFPGQLPTVWNVPRHSNPYFVGREPTLAEAHRRLIAADVTRRRVVLTGLGGVGKSQLAAEYAYRHRADYDLVWWVRGTQPTSLSSDYAALAAQPPLADLKLGRRARQELVVAAVRGWLEAMMAGCWLSTTSTTRRPSPTCCHAAGPAR